MRKVTALACCAALALTGCAVKPENAFPEAATPQQCYAAFVEAGKKSRQAESNARYGSGNALGTSIGVSIGRGINESVNRNRYALCLQRNGATEADLRAIEAQAGKSRRGGHSPDGAGFGRGAGAAAQPAAPGCPAGASILYRGSLYC